MLDHIGLRTAQYDALLAFYEAALAPIGYRKMVEFEGAAGLGADFPGLWIGIGDRAANIHIALRVQSQEQVDGFYHAALAAGATDNGAPGLRTEYSPGYYAAFVLDPDGNNLEVVFHAPA
jgi:catechol 2,3-dioxygenase-like lactoylglutathione lyase family enzyme